MSDASSLGFYFSRNISPAAGFCKGATGNVKVLASKNQVKKSRKQGKSRKSDNVSLPAVNRLIGGPDELSHESSLTDGYFRDTINVMSEFFFVFFLGKSNIKY